MQSRYDNTFFVTVDCIEFYSERLLAICISQSLNTIISRAAKQVCGKGKPLKPNMMARFSFKVCKNIDLLNEQLKGLQSIVDRTKR